MQKQVRFKMDDNPFASKKSEPVFLNAEEILFECSKKRGVRVSRLVYLDKQSKKLETYVFHVTEWYNSKVEAVICARNIFEINTNTILLLKPNII